MWKLSAFSFQTSSYHTTHGMTSRIIWKTAHIRNQILLPFGILSTEFSGKFIPQEKWRVALLTIHSPENRDNTKIFKYFGCIWDVTNEMPWKSSFVNHYILLKTLAISFQLQYTSNEIRNKFVFSNIYHHTYPKKGHMILHFRYGWPHQCASLSLRAVKPETILEKCI